MSSWMMQPEPYQQMRVRQREGGRKSNHREGQRRGTHKERDREIRNWIQERSERIAKGRQEGRKEPRRQKGERNSETGILRKAWRLRMKGCPIRPQVAALYKRFLHVREKAQIWQHELLSSQFLL